MGTHVRTEGWSLRDRAPLQRHYRSHRVHRLRLAAAAAALTVVGVVALAIGGGASTPPRHVTVHAGDTLWSIAAATYGGADVQPRVVQIEAANHLAGPALKPGEVLILPGP